MSMHRPPPFDPELQQVLDQLPPFLKATMTSETIAFQRESFMAMSPTVEELLVGRSIKHTERAAPGPDGAPDLILSIFARDDHTPGGPALYHTHGGGMVNGDRFTLVDHYFDWIESMDLVLVSVEYRRAPEHPDPAPVEDCYAGLVWAAAHADDLEFDAARLIVTGASAGGGLAAGVALMARDRSGPSLAGQLLVCPMIDDRDDSSSTLQIDGIGIWGRETNKTGWTALLGERRGTDEVSIYAAPARATDLADLPPTYIEVGSAEVFRDESVAYASRLWAAGGDAELHVWPGGFHGFQFLAPQSVLSRQASQDRTRWLRRLLAIAAETMSA